MHVIIQQKLSACAQASWSCRASTAKALKSCLLPLIFFSYECDPLHTHLYAHAWVMALLQLADSAAALQSARTAAAAPNAASTARHPVPSSLSPQQPAVRPSLQPAPRAVAPGSPAIVPQLRPPLCAPAGARPSFAQIVAGNAALAARHALTKPVEV